MFEKHIAGLLLVTFVVGLAILAVSWAYSGDILPSQPTRSSSDYDKAAFYIGVGIWIVTAVSGVALIIWLWTKQSTRDR